MTRKLKTNIDRQKMFWTCYIDIGLHSHVWLFSPFLGWQLNIHQRQSWALPWPSPDFHFSFQLYKILFRPSPLAKSSSSPIPDCFFAYVPMFNLFSLGHSSNLGSWNFYTPKNKFQPELRHLRQPRWWPTNSTHQTVLMFFGKMTVAPRKKQTPRFLNGLQLRNSPDSFLPPTIYNLLSQKKQHGPIPALPSFGDGVHQDQNAAHGKAGKVQPLLPQIGPYRQQQPFPSRAASGGRHQQLTGVQVANHQDGETHGNDLRKMEKGDWCWGNKTWEV